MTDTLQILRRDALALLRPPPSLSTAEWIERNVYLPDAASALPGRMRLWLYQRGICDALDDPAIERVSVLKSARRALAERAASMLDLPRVSRAQTEPSPTDGDTAGDSAPGDEVAHPKAARRGGGTRFAEVDAADDDEDSAEVAPSRARPGRAAPAGYVSQSLPRAARRAWAARGELVDEDLMDEAEDDVWALTSAERRAMGYKELPGSLADALKEMENSELVAEALGEHVFDYFLRNKWTEWTNYRSLVTPFELQNYLPL